MSISISSNMSLPIPGVGTEAGPDWANDLNACLTLIDSHTHTAGQGVLITPSALNINADLTFASNSATNLLKAAFATQSAAMTGTNFASVVGGNLYFNDGSGNQIPITSGGGVAGSPGSIGSLTAPAAVTYSAGNKLFTFTADSLKSAALDNGAVTIRETNVASSKGATLVAPAGLVADYTLTLFPALPVSTQAVTLSSTGSLVAVSYDTVGVGMTSTGANAIAASRTRATGSTVAAGGFAISSSTAAFTTTSAPYVDVTNATVTITTSGRPVRLGLVADGTTTNATVGGSVASGTSASQFWKFVRGSTDIAFLKTQIGASSGALSITVPPETISYTDVVAAGTYTYKLMCAVDFGTQVACQRVCLTAYEL